MWQRLLKSFCFIPKLIYYFISCLTLTDSWKRSKLSKLSSLSFVYLIFSLKSLYESFLYCRINGLCMCFKKWGMYLNWHALFVIFLSVHAKKQSLIFTSSPTSSKNWRPSLVDWRENAAITRFKLESTSVLA